MRKRKEVLRKGKKIQPAKPRIAAGPPRARRLPGLEDSAIDVIEQAAANYEDRRDIRMAATQPEVQAKQRLLALMHEHGKAHYRRGDLDITLTAEKETVRVRRLSKAVDDASDAA